MIHHILRYIFSIKSTKILEIKGSELTNRTIGDIGEKLAQNHLISAGYEILETNWRFSKAEIDIIAQKDNVLIFVEVKARSYTYYGEPEDAINEKKEALLIDAAMRYMEKIGHEWEIRFDIIAIVLDKNMTINRLQHFEDAFH